MLVTSDTRGLAVTALYHSDKNGFHSGKEKPPYYFERGRESKTAWRFQEKEKSISGGFFPFGKWLFLLGGVFVPARHYAETYEFRVEGF